MKIVVNNTKKKSKKDEARAAIDYYKKLILAMPKIDPVTKKRIAR